MTLSLTATGEIATFRDVDQFQPAKTQFACGFFSCALVKAMAPVGQVATQTVAEMIAEAEQWYAQVNGDASISNTDGMTLQELYALIVQIGLHFQAANTDAHTLRSWLNLGYPVVVAGAETGFYDMGLGDVVPYPWTPYSNTLCNIDPFTVDSTAFLLHTGRHYVTSTWLEGWIVEDGSVLVCSASKERRASAPLSRFRWSR